MNDERDFWGHVAAPYMMLVGIGLLPVCVYGMLGGFA